MKAAMLGIRAMTTAGAWSFGDSWNACADFRDQIHNVLLRRFAPHPFEHVFVDVLERDVNVARHFLTFGNRLDQFVRPMRRMRVKQANPKITLERV